MIDPQAVIAAATQCLKTPFHHQGRVLGVGMDCAGVLAFCFESLGLPYLDAQCYPRSPFDGQLEKNLDEQPSLKRIGVHQSAPGDLLVMRIDSAPQHLAIRANDLHGKPQVIHSSELHGGVVIHRIDDLWQGRIVRAYRFVRCPQ